MKKAIVTGACGFIGSALSIRLKKEGYHVYGIDNLSRKGNDYNLLRLSDKSFTLYKINVEDQNSVFKTFECIGKVDAVFHLAAQVAVTTSYQNPADDFKINALGSFNVIEAARRYSPEAYCLFASTNKVYGHLKVKKPVSTSYPLCPYTPYGISKATGEMYFTEYGRPETGMRTLALRQSCIYGDNQYGVEDQGWVAWFAIANILNRPITIYGNGEQIRDLLFIDDLINLYILALKNSLTGCFPVGGGSTNQISLNEALGKIYQITNNKFASKTFAEERPGDQPYFVADLSWCSENKIKWTPKYDINTGLAKMIEWIQENKSNIEKIQ